MSVSDIYTVTYIPNGGAPVTQSVTVTAGARFAISETIPGASTNLQLSFTLDCSQLKSCMLLCPTRAMTVKTNSTSAPAATITLAAGVPWLWDVNTGATNPFTSTDVTTLYVTLAAGDDAVLNITGAYDPTP